MKTQIDPQRGEIWWVNFHPQVGDEIMKKRPAIVVSRDRGTPFELRIVVPLTDWKPAFEQHYSKVQITASKVNGLPKDSAADVFQMKSVSLFRFDNQRIGCVTKAELDDICVAIQFVTGMI